MGARNYLCAAARLHAEVALAGRGNVAEALARLERARGALRGLVVPLEAWKSGRVAALLRRRRGDEKGARAAFVAAASPVDAIVHGTDDPALRETFRGSPAVREVIAEAGRL